MSVMSMIVAHMAYSKVESIQRLNIRQALLSDNVELQKVGAAAVRAAIDARDTAQRCGTSIVTNISGIVTAVPPDSLLLPDLTDLLELADRVVPLPNTHSAL